MDWQLPIIVQITCLSEDAIVHRVGTALALILPANRAEIENTVSELGGNHEAGFSLQIGTQADLEARIELELNPSTLGEPIAASVMVSSVPWGQPQPPSYLIIHDDYETVGDWATHPGNKAFVWLLMNVHRLFVTHCMHGEEKCTPDLARASREFCEAVLI